MAGVVTLALRPFGSKWVLKLKQGSSLLITEEQPRGSEYGGAFKRLALVLLEAEDRPAADRSGEPQDALVA